MQLLDRRFTEGGPLKIDDKSGPIQTPRDPMLIRSSFMKRSEPAAVGAKRLISAPFAPKFVSGIEPTSL